MKLHFLKAIYFPADKVERFNNPYLFDEDLKQKHEVDNHQTKLIFLGHFFLRLQQRYYLLCKSFLFILWTKKRKAFNLACVPLSFLSANFFLTFLFNEGGRTGNSLSTTPPSLPTVIFLSFPLENGHHSGGNPFPSSVCNIHLSRP